MINGWLIYMIIAFIVAVLAVPLKYWRGLINAGITGMAGALLIDGTLLSLQAFQFVHTGLRIFGLPVPYWISYFFGGIIFAHHRPFGKWSRFIYVLGFAVFLWLLEYIMILLGFFQHLRWTLFKSMVLNILAFTLVLAIIEWLQPTYRVNRTRQA